MISNCLMSCECQAAQEIGLIVVKITQKWLSKKAISWTDHPMTTNTQLLPFAGHCAHHWGPRSEPSEEKAAHTQQSAVKSLINGTSHGGR